MNQNNQTATSEENGWTKEYCSVQHLRRRTGTNGRWATVTNRGSFAELDGWYQGCGFSPYTATFHTIEEARAAGERWAENGVFPATDDCGWVLA
jgi:hypothetical protein